MKKSKEDYINFFEEHTIRLDSSESRTLLREYFKDCEFRQFTLDELKNGLHWHEINGLILIPNYFYESIENGTKVKSTHGGYYLFKNGDVVNGSQGLTAYGFTKELLEDYIIENRNNIINNIIE
tara:strand:- start:793 stop:1164 length:372 start_codon:yes stop_codon:yes gene_type:complete